MTTAQHLARLAAGVAVAALTATSVHAAEPTTAELMAEIMALKAQLSALQQRVEAQESAQAALPAPAPQAAVVTAAPAAPLQVAAAAPPAPAPRPAEPDTRISGRMYVNLSSIENESDGRRVQPSGYGLEIKRFYIGLDHRFDDTFSANITTDVQYSSAIGATELYIKKAYLQADLSKALTVRVGAYDTPWIGFIDGLYGYRHIEATLVDRIKWGPSADWGVHASGQLGPYVSYAVAAINGAGYKKPLRSKGMDVEGRLSASAHGFTVGVGGYSGKRGEDVARLSNAQHTAKRFDAAAVYASGPLKLGVEYFSARNWENVRTTYEDKSEGWSGFASYNVTPKISAFARYDWVAPRQLTAPTMRERYLHVGLNYQPVRIVDLALVYRRDKVVNGLFNTGGIGEVGGVTGGEFNEIGIYSQVRW